MTTAAPRLAGVLVAAVLGLGACADKGPVAATVNGRRIPAAAVDRDLADLAANERFLEVRSRQGLAFRGTRPGTYDAAAVAEVLNRKVSAALVHQELGRRRIEITGADLDAARETLRRQLVDPADGASLLDGFPGRYLDEQVRIQAESDALQAADGGVDLADAALRAAYQAGAERYRVWCVRWIVYGPGEPEAPVRAAAALAAVAAGADFGQLAVRESTDSSSAARGGALGCQTREGLGRLGDAFRDLTVPLGPGQVAGPGASDLGTFLVQTTDVKVRPFDEVRGAVRASVLAPAAERYEQLLRRLRREADVEVPGRFGTWDRTNPEAIALVPPGGRPTTTTPAAPARP